MIYLGLVKSGKYDVLRRSRGLSGVVLEGISAPRPDFCTEIGSCQPWEYNVSHISSLAERTEWHSRSAVLMMTAGCGLSMMETE